MYIKHQNIFHDHFNFWCFQSVPKNLFRLVFVSRQAATGASVGIILVQFQKIVCCQNLVIQIYLSIKNKYTIVVDDVMSCRKSRVSLLRSSSSSRSSQILCFLEQTNDVKRKYLCIVSCAYKNIKLLLSTGTTWSSEKLRKSFLQLIYDRVALVRCE